MSDNFFALFNKTTNVVYHSDWDEELECIVIDGKKYEIDEEIGDIDEFIDKHQIDLGQITGYRWFGYRGLGCYSASIVIDGVLYSLDVMNDYVVHSLVERVE